LVLRT